MRIAGGRLQVMMLITLLLLGGCASTQSTGSQTENSGGFDQTDLQKRAAIRLQLAISYYEQRQMPVALDEVRQALQSAPDFADAYSVRALIYMEMGEMRLAEDNFLQAIKLAPNNPDFMNNYGWFLCQNGREKQAIGYFDSTLANRSYQSPAKALNNAGLCSLKLKDAVAAERYFSQAFQYEPGNPATNANLAKLYFERGDLERARFYVGRVTKSDGAVPANILWLAIKVERKLGDKGAEASLVAQLRRRYPDSTEFAAYQRGAFDE
jgi:type IV pilus assembly protein PilF